MKRKKFTFLYILAVTLIFSMLFAQSCFANDGWIDGSGSHTLTDAQEAAAKATEGMTWAQKMQYKVDHPDQFSAEGVQKAKDWLATHGGATTPTTPSTTPTEQSSEGKTSSATVKATQDTEKKTVTKTEAKAEKAEPTKKETIAPTCTEKGYTVYVDADGKETKSDYVDALGHDYKVTDHKDATCTTDGYTVKTCSRCKDEQRTVIKAFGHDEGKWSVSKDAKWFTDGEKQLKCTACGALLKTETIPSKLPKPLLPIGIAVVVGGVVGGTFFFLKKKRK